MCDRFPLQGPTNRRQPGWGRPSGALSLMGCSEPTTEPEGKGQNSVWCPQNSLVCKHSQDLAPRIHNLPGLAELAGVSLSTQRLDILADMNAFHIEGRYPESLILPPTGEEARGYLKGAEEVYQWLISQL